MIYDNMAASFYAYILSKSLFNIIHSFNDIHVEFFLILVCEAIQDSAVGIATGYGLDD
jgi:hypothetical protein